MADNPTTRTLANLRDRGYRPFVVESYNAYIKRKKDLYGFIDVVGLNPDYPGVLGVQTTTGDHLAERIHKAKALKAYWHWLQCGNPVEFHGWRKVLAKKGGKLKIWAPRIVRVTWEDREPLF